MKPFFKRITQKESISFIVNGGLTLLLWFVGEKFLFHLLARLMLPNSVDIFAIAGFDSVSPVSTFISTFSAFFYKQNFSGQTMLFLAATLVTQFFLFAFLVRFVFNLMQKYHEKQTAFMNYWKSVQITFFLVPIYFVISMFGLLAEMLLSSIPANPYLGISIFHAIKDAVQLVFFFCLVPAYVFVIKGESIPDALKKSVYYSTKILPTAIVLVLAIVLVTNSGIFILLDSRIVLANLFYPAQLVLQGIGWMLTAIVWFFCGNVYDYVNSTFGNGFASMTKGAENEQILETSY